MKNKVSQKDRILKLLRQNGRISRNDALKMYISRPRLGSIICDFKKEGMDIEAKFVNGDYVYILNDKPKKIVEYKVNGVVVARKVEW